MKGINVKTHQKYYSILIVIVFNITNICLLNSENNKFNMRPLNIKEAIEMNDTNAVKRLINDGFDINMSTGNINETPLFLASVCRRPDMVKLLLELGANPLATNKWGETSFHRAVALGNKKVAEILLAKGSKYDIKDAFGRTPLYVAAKEAQEEMALWLLELGADPNIMSKNSSESILFNAANRGEPKLIRALIDSGARIEGKGPRGKTPLHMLVFHGDLENIKLLINKGADVNATDSIGQTPIMFGIHLGKGDQVDVIDLLISKGADIKKKDVFGRSSLDMVKARKTMNARINYKNAKEKAETEEKAQKIGNRLIYYMKNN